MSKLNSSAPPASEPTDLYRHFDADGRLLYVGISLNAILRLTQHTRRAGWATQIVTIRIERHPTREDAVAAEARAIATERPAHNISGRYVPVNEEYDEAEEMAKLERGLVMSDARRQAIAAWVAAAPAPEQIA